MNQWKMNSADFKRLLEDVQDYKCAITGLPLLPENVEIVYKIPLSKGGKVAAANVYLVHNSVVKLARDYSMEEIVVLAKSILGVRQKLALVQSEWVHRDTQPIRLKIHHFNEQSRNFRKPTAKQLSLTWGAAYRNAVRKFSSKK